MNKQSKKEAEFSVFCKNARQYAPFISNSFSRCKGIQDSLHSWILDSTSWIPDSQVLDSSLCHWNLDSGFQSLVGFRIP